MADSWTRAVLKIATGDMTVSVIGSCRVFNPVGIQEKKGAIRVGHDWAVWYTHSTIETLQKIDIVRKKLTPPDHLLPLIVNKPKEFHPDRHRSDFYSGTDVFIVELSSLKKLSYEGWYLQSVCRQRALQNKLGRKAHSIAEATKYQPMTEDDIVADMDAICTALGKPVLFVNHICTTKDNGEPFPERETLRNANIRFCSQDSRAAAFDPTVIVEEYGVDKAMIDASHYGPDFRKKILGPALVRAAQALALSASGRPQLGFISERQTAIDR